MTEWFDTIPEEKRDEVRKKFQNAKGLEAQVAVLREWHPKGYVNLKPVQNLEEYFRYLKLITTSASWFRGESKDYGHLIPKLLRNTSEKDIEGKLSKEGKFLVEFRRRARALIPGLDHQDIWSWYFIMQHYGGPTRLLDWTQDASVALFFALDGASSDDTEKTNPLVHVLSPGILLKSALDSIGETDRGGGRILYPGDNPTERWISNFGVASALPAHTVPTVPIALLPTYFDPRITAQKSCFTLFGKQALGLETPNGEMIKCPCCTRRGAHKIALDRKMVDSLKHELRQIGVTPGSIYPGLDGLARDIDAELS